MNCEKGDLAIVVRCNNEAPHALGTVVRCVSPSMWGDIPCWVVDPPVIDRLGRTRDRICDQALRPIRDPGDDAKDETLQWLPVPSRDEVPA